MKSGPGGQQKMPQPDDEAFLVYNSVFILYNLDSDVRFSIYAIQCIFDLEVFKKNVTHCITY